LTTLIEYALGEAASENDEKSKIAALTFLTDVWLQQTEWVEKN
jgi:hypothetical protein